MFQVSPTLVDFIAARQLSQQKMITSSISCSYILYIMIYQSLITQTMIHYCIALIVSRVLDIEILHSYPITPHPVLHHGPGLVPDPWWCNWLEAWRAVSCPASYLVTTLSPVQTTARVTYCDYPYSVTTV